MGRTQLRWDSPSSLVRPQPPVPAAVVSDSFNRADGALNASAADTGQVWSADAPWGVVSNVATLTSAPSAFQFALIDSVSVADGTVACLVTPSGGLVECGLAVRASDASNLIYIDLTWSGGPWGVELFKRTAGSFASIVARAPIAAAVSATQAIPLSVGLSGTSIVVSSAGVPVTSYSTSTGYEANTKHGLVTYGSPNGMTYEDFTVGP